MAIEYGATGDGRSVSKSFERLAVQDNTGNVAEHILKYTREEETLETVSDTFGAPLLDGNEVVSATVTESVDEAVIEGSEAGQEPRIVRFYNPRSECSATFLGSENVGDAFEFDGTSYDTVSSELSETLGDVKRVSVRGISYGTASSVTIGDATGGGTNRHEKRYSNTDYVRESTTNVSFGGG
jgi:hypothetical protein